MGTGGGGVEALRRRHGRTVVAEHREMNRAILDCADRPAMATMRLVTASRISAMPTTPGGSHNSRESSYGKRRRERVWRAEGGKPTVRRTTDTTGRTKRGRLVA